MTNFWFGFDWVYQLKNLVTEFSETGDEITLFFIFLLAALLFFTIVGIAAISQEKEK